MIKRLISGKSICVQNKLRIEILPDEQKTLLEVISDFEWFSEFYLAGGTGLALQLGHRQSIDFDFFTEKEINNPDILRRCREIAKFELFSEDKNTVIGALNEVRLSFMTYPYPLLEDCIRYNHMRIASLMDIAMMKLEAISSRGSKKDFVDFYFLNRTMSLDDLFAAHANKYGEDLSNRYLLQKSLVYYNDAENQPMPVMIDKVTWQNIKSAIIESVSETKI